jgi:hypothetical protein
MLFSSCQKEVGSSPEPVQSTGDSELVISSIQAAQQTYSQLGIGAKLAQKINAQTTFKWYPTWNTAFTVGASLYVPLRFTVDGQEGPHEALGSKRFLVMPVNGSKQEPKILVYFFSKPQEAQYFDDAAAFIRTFSGERVTHSLSGDSHTSATYLQGAFVEAASAKPVAAGKGNATSTLICTVRYECSWEANCTTGSGTHRNYASTYSTNGCLTPPAQEACGVDNWGMSWHNVGSYAYQTCIDYPDPTQAPILPDGVYSIYSPLLGQLQVLGASQADAAEVVGGSYTGADNQKWLIQFGFLSAEERVYIITAVHSNKLLGHHPNSHLPYKFYQNTPIATSYGISDNQQWVIEKDTDTGLYYILCNGTRKSIGGCTLVPR